MKVYQVGGSVRDLILNRPAHDRDYVVVGATAEEMLARGFLRVGHEFPVFLHPRSKEEYALARREIKHEDGSIELVFTPEVTLAEDIERRDFTCNALVLDNDIRRIIDLTGGFDDIRKRRLRHIHDDYFALDPLRVLRMCRFAAQLDFEIAPETMVLARKMVANGLLNHLTAERVWKELEKALASSHFPLFIEAARACGALKIILPEVDALWQIPERSDYHPEGNSGEHTLLALRQYRGNNPLVNFALLLHDVGKTETPADILPAHYGHEIRGAGIVRRICRHLKTPNVYRDFVSAVCTEHMKFWRVNEMRLSRVYDMVAGLSNHFKDKERWENFIEICRCDMYGRARGSFVEESRHFKQNCERCRKIMEKAAEFKAEDMPRFDELPKDEKFGELYRSYCLRQLQGI